jgi:hypothetical protein
MFKEHETGCEAGKVPGGVSAPPESLCRSLHHGTLLQEYMTTSEAAQYLRKSGSWLLKQSDLPYLRGTPNTYRRKDLDEWFARHMHKPAA